MIRKPATVGEILQEEFLKPMRMTQLELANRIMISAGGISRIMSSKNKVTVETAFKLAKFFNTTEDFWLNIQRRTDIYEAKNNKDLKEILNKIIPLK